MTIAYLAATSSGRCGERVFGSRRPAPFQSDTARHGQCGQVLFFVCALYTHIRAGDYSAQFALAIGFLGLNVAALALSLPGG